MMRLRLYLGTRPSRIADMVPVTLMQGLAGLLEEFNATITPGVGVWDGTTELSVVIELLGQYGPDRAAALAEFLREEYDQASVLWTLEPIACHGSAERIDPITTLDRKEDHA